MCGRDDVWCHKNHAQAKEVAAGVGVVPYVVDKKPYS
jgi:hypothetical protein